MCLPFLEVLTVKDDNFNGEGKKFKVRLTARGDLAGDFSQYYAPVVSAEVIRSLLAIVAGYDLFMRQMDVASAYLYAKLDESVYLYLPDGHPQKSDSNSKVYKCDAALYGLKQSALKWFQRISDFLEKIKFVPSRVAPGLFVLREGNYYVWIVLYVDDLILASTSHQLLDKVDKLIQKEFKVKSTEDPTKFIGMELKELNDGIALSQSERITQIAKNYPLGSRSFDTPMAENFKWDPKSEVLENKRALQKIIGELSYMSNLVRHDVAFPVNKIARTVGNPTRQGLKAARRVLEYLVQTKDQALVYKRWKALPNGNRKWDLSVYSDASFADLENEKAHSSGGYVIKLNGSTIAWKSKKLDWVACSTTIAEFYAIHLATLEAIYIARFLEEMFDARVFPVKLYTDNTAAKDLILGNKPKGATKYLETKYYLAEEMVKKGLLTIEYVPSEKNIADLMTKAVKPRLFRRFVEELNQPQNYGRVFGAQNLFSKTYLSRSVTESRPKLESGPPPVKVE